MKIFTATQLNKKPQEVFAAANEYGSVDIKHDRYPNVIFTINAYKQVGHVGGNKAATELSKQGEDILKKAFARAFNPDPYETPNIKADNDE